MSTLSGSFSMIRSRDLDVDRGDLSVCDPHLVMPCASYNKVMERSVLSVH